ncbi:uncharacterized protein N7483_010611 [Penicillium malachiteum]|uniref:uncharacterized protein n=1 Tax=Penicillium malachiteum TaxID=1324776 RepID=UPI002548FA1C|nr:uncharacterized protein N7483_010611 [Penicillium malachiteum]KAJ5713430.1 hypothetical protein N7483_010611 [Penicillium malachiteum]
MTSLPSVPTKHADFLSYVQSHPETSIRDLIKPYNEYDSVARKIFAQEPSHPMVQDNYANIVPLYSPTGSTDVRIRARDLASETPADKEKYILQLDEKLRRTNNSPAVVPKLAEFQENFALFTENSLSELDWSNVVAAGSAVVTSALPVPEEYRGSKRGLREYYHDKFAPASDVDLFLYGLTEEQAIEKIKHIEDSIQNAILYETTTIRTKNTVTIASQYPTRHVQIVLRIYHSIAEILTGFDVDCSCAAYDGKQVYASPRAIASYITQTNQIDLTRRSPSYENRLSKYSHRGFEVFWDQLDRSKVDPTVFERSFARTEGLARLLVLEKLPKTTDRENYLDKRRRERGRPALSWRLRHRQGRELKGNIKDEWEDEVPEWQADDQISSYHTFTIPYGRRFNAKSIEKLLYTKDLLLNAQWNLPKDREVYLHRHPAFFGDAEHVIGDCCGFCPVPTTEEELKVAEEESKIYISGSLTFIKDDPGRQEIGSFNPITETDWTEMAYIGHTERLCQAIVAGDLEAVKGFFADEEANVDRRDYTGRTPLQLACMCSTPEVVQCLVDHGARLVSRMADGNTALHLAAARGSVEIIHILLTKSNQNEEEESKKQESRSRGKKRKAKELADSGDEAEDAEMRDVDASSRTSASFVKIDNDGEEIQITVPDALEENEQEPDIYEINTPTWDTLATPLHLAILRGHIEVVKTLVSSFGADVMMPVKIFNEHNRTPAAAILNLVLVLSLPLAKAREMSQTLLKLGASPAQADLSHCTPLHYIAQSNYADLFDLYMEHDGPALQRTLNHLAVHTSVLWGNTADFFSAFMNSIGARNPTMARKLLDLGSKPQIELTEVMNALKSQLSDKFHIERIATDMQAGPLQPIMYAVGSEMPMIATELLHRGADPNTLAKPNFKNVSESLLDRVRSALKDKRDWLSGESASKPGYNHPWMLAPIAPMAPERDDKSYLAETSEDSYSRLVTKIQLKAAHDRVQIEADRKRNNNPANQPYYNEKRQAVEAIIREYENLERELLVRGAKTYEELHPSPQLQLQPVYQQDFQSALFGLQHGPFTPHQNQHESFRITYQFQMPTITAQLSEAYRYLFEATWHGDLPTVKAMTLGNWGSFQDQPPLEIAVSDSYGISCLSIAILRGHLSIAEAIVQIIQAQYKRPEAQGQARFEIDSDAESSDGEGEGLNIRGHTVDDKFTHENIGEISTQVQSAQTPLSVLQRECSAFLFFEDEASSELIFTAFPSNLAWAHERGKLNTLFEYAIFKNDPSLLDFLLRLGKECANTDPSGKVKFELSQREFQLALALGHTESLAKMIQSSAEGLPIAHLAEKSGVKVKEEHLYYPGLSIRGKKRKDWATAGQVQEAPPPTARSPLLVSAIQGNLAATEWFLGTAPGRYYVDYVNSHMDDENIQRLSQSKLGLEGSVLNWLQTRNNLVLHCAVLSRPCEESERLVQYLVDHHPECLEVRASGGHTPLSLAFLFHKTSFARILVAAGADQTVRDVRGANLLHLLLTSKGQASLDAEIITDLINLLNPQLISSMLLQRFGEGSLTPFAQWLNAIRSWDDPHDNLKPSNVAKIIFDLADSSNQKHLELLDGSGNTPVHHAVKKVLSGPLELMLDRRPDLLHRENATGSTPLELAVDAWISSVTRHPPSRAFDISTTRTMERWKNIVDRPGWFYAGNPDLGTDLEIMVRICQARSEKQVGNRRLVTLFEANEVAKRLTRMANGFGGRSARFHHNSGDDEKDEVALWANLDY